MSGFQGLAVRLGGMTAAAPGRDGIMASAGVIGTVGGDGGDLLPRRNLGKQVRQHRRVADIAGGDLDRPDLQCFLVDPEVDLAPNPASRATVLARVPLSFTFHLDAGAVDEQVKPAVGAPIRDGDVQGLLATRQGAEVRHGPAKAGQFQQARNEPYRLAEWQPDEDLEGQAGLDRGVAIGLLATATPGRYRLPLHRGIEPDGQRSALPQRMIVALPVGRLVCRLRRSAHVEQLACWIHEMNPHGFAQQRASEASAD